MAKVQLGAELSRAARLLDSGRTREAEDICQQVLKRDRRDVQAYQMLGLIESMKGRFDHAVSSFQRGLKIEPKNPILLCGLGKARTSQGAYDKSLACYDKALAVDAGYPPALAGKADALEHVGRFDEARALLEPIIEAKAEDGEIAMIYATLLQRAKRDEEAIELLERHLAGHLYPVTQRKVLFCIGKSYDRQKQYDAAFDAFQRANALLARPFDIGVIRERFTRIRHVFSKENFPRLTRSSTDSEVPIFVVSMPRSGSTLVEQILSAHPAVFGAGETDEMILRMNELAQEVGGAFEYPEAVNRLKAKSADRLSARYLGRVRQLDRAAERIVDKNLQNFRLLGLINLLFPKARVIYCRRDPMAVCFSCYMLPLSPVALPYSTDLRNLGLYHTEYERLMEFWIETLDIPIMSVRYEDIVADQERASREIIEFAGLPWDDACLRFYEAKRDVATASYDQVRQPIYKAAVKRYAHYDEHLEPLRSGLGKLM